jgi:hypothetical protein
MSALVAVSSWACSSGSQSDDGANGSSGASSQGGGFHAGAGTAGKSTGTTGGKGSLGNGGSGNSSAGGSSVAGQSSTAGLSGTNGGANGTAGGNSTSGGTAGTGTAKCDNGIDDDGDGFIYGFDPECTGPFDDDEGTYATGIPGDNRDPKWQDCFFDGNSGAGDDNCRYATGCLTGELEQTDPNCKLTDACVKFCAPLTQNGCDCFGCCTVQRSDGSTVDIAETATCSLANIDDTKECPRCVKNTQCGNTCGECELCPGKTVADLPASCTPPGTGGSGNAGAPGTGGGSNVGGGSPGSGGTTGAGGSSATGGGGGVTWTCDGGQVCGPNLPPCAGNGEYCSLGCCIPSIR